MNIYVYILPCVYGVQGSVRDLGQVYMENPPNLALPVVFTFQLCCLPKLRPMAHLASKPVDFY